MNKLGFAIKLASGGAGNAIECNKGQWTSKVVDIREYLKLFNGLQGTDNIVTFMSFDEGGCFLTQLRAISGRGGDFLSGWIYIPNTVEASGEEIMSAYNYVRNILSQSNLSDLKDDIESFFSKEYSSKEVAAQYIASRGQLYGVRFLGHYTLKEIVGEDRYQPYYSDYKAVFLLNKEDEVAITKDTVNNFRDLTDKNIVKTSVLVPPTNESLQALGKGTKICTADGSYFNKPILVELETKVFLCLKRAGFEDQKLEIQVTSKRQEINFSNQKVEWKKRISDSMFTITNDHHEKIKNRVRILVNGKDISNQPVYLSESDCLHAEIKVSATDYMEYKGIRNLLGNDLNIQLNRRVKGINTRIELSNGKHAMMTLESEYLPYEDDSPLKGYDYESDREEKILILSPVYVWKQRLLGFLGCLAIVLLVHLYKKTKLWIDEGCTIYKWSLCDCQGETEIEGPTNDVVDPVPSNQSEEDSQLKSAIQYLDDNAVWTKSGMDSLKKLSGLFLDMNNFELEKIVNRKESEQSDQFSKLCEAAQKNIDNNWNPKQGDHNPTYNKENDEMINIKNYLNWLAQDQTSKKDKPSRDSSSPQKESNNTNGGL